MQRRMMTLTAALVAMVMATPIWSQTITTNGIQGGPACSMGYSAVKNTIARAYLYTRITNTSLPFQLSSVMDWAGLRSIMGVADNPVSSLALTGKIFNGRTGATVQTIDLGTITSSQNLSYATTNVTLMEKTPYVVIMYTDFAGHGENNPFMIDCFVTGGTYTLGNNTTNTSLGSTGCFSISPRTPLDVRNCLCGRGNTGTVGSASYDYTSLRAGWGCR